MAITSTRQRNAVSEGAALGLLRCGHTTLPVHPVAVELAFGGSWRSWSHSGGFPQVRTDLRHGLGEIHVLTRAKRSQQTLVLYWERIDGQWHVCRRQDDWDPDDDRGLEFAVSMIDGDVPLQGWVDLAQGMLNRLKAGGTPTSS